MRDNPFEKHPIITWFADNPVVANLIMIAILAGGTWNALRIRKETFPQFDAQSVEVRVPFLGGTPEDVERGVAIKIEESLQGVDGIDHIRSTSLESGATVTVDAVEKYPIDKLLNDVKIRVDAIPSFPEEAEKPVISEQRRTRDILWVAVYGDVAEAALKETARRVRDEVLKLETVSRVDTFGARDYEVSVEVSEDKLRTYQLTFDEVARAVADNSLDLSGGVIRSERGDISIRSRSQAYTAADFAELPLRIGPDGTRISLRDVASIRDGFVDQEFLTRFDGKPALALQLITEGRDNTIRASRDARALIAEFRDTRGLPHGVALATWNDSSEVISSRLDLMIKNGLIGIALVFVVLALFLHVKLAFWVAVGIPVSIGGAMCLFPLPFFDFSLNQLTTFAFIVVLGIIVDDAIIIGESIFSAKEQQKHYQDREAYLRATVRGVSKVIVPAAFGVLTTIAAFYPLTNVAGRMGNIYGVMAMVVIFCLIFSLIESKIILPSHLAHIDVHHRARNPVARAWDFFQGGVTSGLRLFITRLYLPFLRFLFPYRYLVLGVFVAGLVTVVGLVPAGILRFVFFPSIFRDNIAATLELEQGQPVSYLHDTALRIEAGLRRATSELEAQRGETILRHVQISSSTSTNAAIAAELTPSEERQTSTGEVVNLWRRHVGQVPGARALSFAGTAGPPGQDFNIQLESPDLAALRAAADDLKAKVATYPGVFDVQDSFRAGQPEIRLVPTPAGEAAGLDRRDLARNVRDAFYGREAQRMQRGRDEVKVMVRYPSADRAKLDTLRDMRVRSEEGATVPFSIVAHATYGHSLASIERADSKRVVNVSAGIDKSVTSGQEVLGFLREDFFPQFFAAHPNVDIALRGEAEQRAKSLRSLGFGFVVSIILIYVLLAVPLKSYVRPLFIMSVIPFGIGGAILGHYIYGIPLSILSMFGTLALSGVVVNDSLVLVHRIQDLRNEDAALSLADAIHRAAGERFRPILLTSLTTFAGLIPLLAETAVQAQFLKPMAVSLGFGVLFATVVTLLLLPAILLIAQDVKRSFTWWFRAISRRKEQPETA